MLIRMTICYYTNINYPNNQLCSYKDLECLRTLCELVCKQDDYDYTK